MNRSLCIVLSEGFEDCPITIRIAGTIVFSSKSVSTKLLTGLAEQIWVADELANKRPLVVEVSTCGHQESINVDSSDVHCLTVWIHDAEIRHKLSSEPLGYA